MLKNRRGFSLVELLVVTVIMGLVIGAVYTLYISTQRTAITSEEVVDVQQNLRFALDQLAKDIRMAGFLELGANPRTPIDSQPALLSDGNLVINTAPVQAGSALVVGNGSYDASGSEVKLELATADMVDLFESADDVMIIRNLPDANNNDPLNILPPSIRSVLIFRGKIKDKVRNDPSITLDELNQVLSPLLLDSDPIISPGDIIYQSFNPAASVVYSLAEDPDTAGGNVNLLERNDIPLAGKIADVAFDYITDGGEIVAVRVRIEGQTDETMTGREGFSGIKTRALESVVRLRNR